MSEMIRCPHCGREFKLKEQMRGRRVTCKCGQPFDVDAAVVEPEVEEAEEDDWYDLAPANLAGGAAAEAGAPTSIGGVGTIGVPAGRPAPRARTPMVPLSDKEKGVVKLAGSLAVFGVLVMVLPLFGLQFRKLKSLPPEAAVPAGVSLVALGLVIVGLVFLKRKPMLIVWGGFGAVGVFVLLCGGILAVTGPWNHDPDPSRLVPAQADPAAGNPHRTAGPGSPGWGAPPSRPGAFDPRRGRAGAGGAQAGPVNTGRSSADGTPARPAEPDPQPAFGGSGPAFGGASPD